MSETAILEIVKTESFYEDIKTTVCSRIKQTFNNHFDVEDLIQECAEHSIKQLKNFNPEKSNFKTFINRIVHGKLSELFHYNKFYKYRQLVDGDKSNDETNMSIFDKLESNINFIENTEMKIEIERFAKTLSKTDCNILYLITRQFKIKDIAESYAKSTAWARKKIDSIKGKYKIWDNPEIIFNN